MGDFEFSVFFHFFTKIPLCLVFAHRESSAECNYVVRAYNTWGGGIIHIPSSPQAARTIVRLVELRNLIELN